MDMSLVQGLTEKQTRDKELYLSKLVLFLQSAGIDASFNHETVLSLYKTVRENEPVINVTGQYISKVTLRTRLFAYCGSWKSISFFDYESLLTTSPPPRFCGKMKAYVRPVVQGRFLGIFGGRVAAVKWAGGELAELLNSDSGLAEKLFALSAAMVTRCHRQFRDTAVAEISGPQFDSPPPFLSNVMSYPDLPVQKDDFFYAFAPINTIPAT
jgi:hypothetical protein